MYVALDEPDGVAGVAAVRNSEPSIQEEIIEFESTGIYMRHCHKKWLKLHCMKTIQEYKTTPKCKNKSF